MGRQTQPATGYARPIAPWGGLCLLLVVLAASIAYDLYADYRRIYETAESQLRYQVGILEDSLGRRLQATSNAIDAIREDVSVLLRETGGSARLNHRLDILASAMTGVRTFVVVNVDGVVVASNRHVLIGQDFRESARYKAIHAATDPNLLHLSAPYLSPLNVRVISAGKMIADQRGRFAGYVLAILDPELFDALMRPVLYAPEMRASLIHADGEVILRLPDPEGLTGSDLSKKSGSLFAQFIRSGGDRTLLDSYSSVTGKALLGMMTHIRPSSSPVDKPLVFAALIEKRALFAPWWAELELRLVFWLCFALIAAAMLALYQRRQVAYAQLAAEKQAEHAAAEAQLDAMADQLALALDGADMGAYHWNVATGQIVWTETYRRVMQLDAQVEANYENWLAGLHPDDRQKANQAVREALDNHHDLAIEYRTLGAQGEVRWIASKGRFFPGEDGKVAHMEGVVSDITERKLAELNLAERNRQVELLNTLLAKRAEDAESATRAKDVFMRTVSHELRTPLHHIMSGCEIVSRGPLDDRQGRWFNVIHDAARELARMVQEVIDMTHMAAGHVQLEKMRFSPARLLDEVRLMLVQRAELKGLSVSIRLADDIPSELLGDQVRLSQALYNLLDNAIKFTEIGEVVLSASLAEVDAEGVVMCFAVSDTGIGIPEAALTTLLSESQSFRQLDGSDVRKYGGLGIGLGNVRALARLMGGKIGAESTPGRGSRFWFTVRLLRA